MKFIETVAGNEVNTDTFDTELFDKIIDCLDKMIRELEATNPNAAISGEPFTVWEAISGLMNLEKINLDERLQVNRSRNLNLTVQLVRDRCPEFSGQYKISFLGSP